MINIAIIGVGNIALTHLEAYSKNKNVKVVAFCDINPERLAYMGKRFGIDKLYTDMHEMFRQGTGDRRRKRMYLEQRSCRVHCSGA